MTELLTLDQLASILGLHRRTIERRRVKGQLGIPEHDVGELTRLPRFFRADVEAYLRQREARQKPERKS